MVLTPVKFEIDTVLLKRIQLLNILLIFVSLSDVVKLIFLASLLQLLNIPDIVLTPVKLLKAIVLFKRMQLLNMLLVSVSEAFVANVKF